MKKSHRMHVAWAMSLDWPRVRFLTDRGRWEEIERTPVTERLFPIRALRVLAASNIHTIGELLQVEPDSFKSGNFGPKSAEEIVEGVRWLLRSCPGDQRPPTFDERKEKHQKTRALRVYRLYLKLGTLEAAGRKIGVTKEGVRLIIKQGVERGWLDGDEVKRQKRKMAHDRVQHMRKVRRF